MLETNTVTAERPWRHGDNKETAQHLEALRRNIRTERPLTRSPARPDACSLTASSRLAPASRAPSADLAAATDVEVDIAINYKTAGDLTAAFKQAPKGTDIYFDNVGAETLGAAILARQHKSAASEDAALKHSIAATRYQVTRRPTSPACTFVVSP